MSTDSVTASMLFAFQKALPPGKDKKRVFDPAVPNLIHEVRRSKISTFIRVPNAHRRIVEIKLGEVGISTLDQLRREAKRVRAEALLGRDPAAEKSAARASMDVTTYATDHYLLYCEDRHRSIANTRCYIRRITDFFGRKRLDELTWADVRDFHE